MKENLPMVAIAFGIAFAQALILFLIERLAHWLREKKRVQELPEARFVETPYTALSLQEMQMLLVAACEDAVRRLRPDGTGIVRVNVLGWSWGVSPMQMSTFLAWVRGRTVYWGKAMWRARVEPRAGERTAVIVFEKEHDVSITLNCDVSQFRTGIESVQEVLGDWKPQGRHGLS